ncbi:hypothetical protein GCM10010278_80370 [Streptomyces melanogenes]|nr:hypothetical protein GCM10010278_80370 [Streptomyces melanogenes]
MDAAVLAQHMRERFDVVANALTWPNFLYTVVVPSARPGRHHTDRPAVLAAEGPARPGVKLVVTRALGHTAPPAPQAGASMADVPVATIPRGRTPRLTLAQSGLFGALLTPVVVTMALRIGQVDPDGKEGSRSLVLGVGALSVTRIKGVR